MYNFETLNKRVLKKLGYTIDRALIEDAVNCKPGAVESILNTLQFNMAKYREKRASIDAGTGSNSQKDSENKISNTNRQSQDYNPSKGGVSNTMLEQALHDKDATIKELQETIEILELKVSKLEQLVRLKDLKIQKLSQQN